jgi:transcriptional regulator
MEEQNAMIIGGLVLPLILLTVREIFSWLSKKNLQSSDTKISMMADAIKTLSERAEKVEFKLDNLNHLNKTMYEWHDKSDEDGVKIWYVRRSLEEALHENVKAINILAKNSEAQTRLLEDMVKQNKEMSKDQMILSKLLERLVDKQ